MSGFVPSSDGTTGLDPHKRVNYRLGLVLGEDEFRQDQFHHRDRDHHATRALHGYGTVSGLGVSFDDATGRLYVQPGLAVDPAGRLICVPVKYCALLSAWVQEHATEDLSGGVPPVLTVYVSLCWTECETDDVPIPADSCLSAEDSRAASRLLDSFELRLTLEPPTIVGEVAPGSADSLTHLVDELHGILDVSGGSPPDMVGVASLLRDWAVERRPEVVADAACLPAPDDVCVLLARVDLDLTDGPSGVGIAAASVVDSDRPILVSTRLLQEALFAVGLDQEVPDHEHSLSELDDVDLGAGPAVNDILRFDGTNWIADAESQPIGQNQDAGGDLRGRYPDPSLGAIQATPLDARDPAERDVLIMSGGRWIASRPWILPFVTVQPMGDLFYALWFNLDAPGNRVAIDVDTLARGLVVQRETGTSGFLDRVGPVNVDRLIRNIFRVQVSDDSTPLRFTFDLERLQLTTGGTSVLDWANKSGIWFVGQSGTRGQTITSFTLVGNWRR